MRRALSGHKDAVAELRRVMVRPIAESYRARSPQSLVERLYEAGCDALDHSLQAASDQDDAERWAMAAMQIREAISKQYEDWAWDRDLAALSQRANSYHAEEALLKKYNKRIESVARRFHELCSDIDDDLMQEGRILFYSKLIPTYDWSTGHTLWEYASKAIWRKMRDLCLSWTKARRSADPTDKLVLATIEHLRQEFGREPTLAEIAEECGLDQASVTAILQRRQPRQPQPLDRPTGDDSDDAPARQIADSSKDPGRIVEAQSFYEEVIDFLNQTSGDLDGVKWVVAYTLNYCEDHPWREIASVLEECRPVNWPDLHAHYQLPAVVPTIWAEICALFTVPPPRLSEETMKKWFTRRRNKLFDEFPAASRQPSVA